MTSILSLARGRLRPVPWEWLTVLAAGWFLLTDLLAAVPRDPQVGIMVFRWAALLLGLGGVVLGAPETDPPRDLLRATPVPRWRTLALRLAGWLLLGVVPVVVLAVRLGGTAGWTAADLARATLPGFGLVTAVGFLAASLTSVVGGGAAAMAAMVGLDTAGWVWPAGFPIQLLSVPGDPYWPASRAWIVVGSLGLITLALALEHRSGQRLGMLRRRRRRHARPHQASEARARP
jgi:hypothetical protein